MKRLEMAQTHMRAMVCWALMISLSVGLFLTTGCGGSSNSSSNSQGSIVSATKAVSYTKDQANALLQQEAQAFHIATPPQAQNGLDLYVVTYKTVDVNGAETTASGALAVPTGTTAALPLLSYQHGTTTKKSVVPSDSSDVVSQAVVLLYASQGYMVAAADYLGLGQSSLTYHPFVHASSEASATLDLLRAARKEAQTLNVALNSQVFLVGHSEGGHATLALHRAIEQQASGEFTVTASAPAAGPYDLSGSQLTQILNAPGPDSAAYTAYILTAYNNIYALYTTPSTVFASPYDTTAPPLFDGTHALSDVATALQITPTALLNPTFVADVKSNASNPLVVALGKNNVYDWKPVAPVQFFYGGADTDVAPQNSTVAYNRMKALGGNVTLTNVGDTLDHTASFLPSILGALTWFNTLKK